MNDPRAMEESHPLPEFVKVPPQGCLVRGALGGHAFLHSLEEIPSWNTLKHHIVMIVARKRRVEPRNVWAADCNLEHLHFSCHISPGDGAAAEGTGLLQDDGQGRGGAGTGSEDGGERPGAQGFKDVKVRCARGN